MSIDDKLELAVWLCEKNDCLALSGSLMLYCMGIDMGREPQDIDLIVDASCDYEDDFILPPFYKELEIENIDGYEVLKRIQVGDCKVEFIRPEIRQYFKRQEVILNNDYTRDPKVQLNEIELKKLISQIKWSRPNHWISMALLKDLIKAKEEYVEEDTHQPYLLKTYDDLKKLKEYCETHPEVLKGEEKWDKTSPEYKDDGWLFDDIECNF